MSWRRSVRRLVALLVYFTTFTLGAGLFVVNPVRVLLAVPVLAGVAVLAHAVRTNHLDAVGVAILWLWGAVLALSVGGAVVEGVFRREVPPLVELPVARVVGTVALVAVPLAVYVRRLRRDRRAKASSEGTV